ncbi:Lipocalin-like domain-containing protein [Stachybotrys elegans]|uniref:Lipocalin-like domain-containing protein n=1 Tax=Stachybotrys elegans TaxID=80388 RepID=A0A8K0SQI7_9HYPO|nr:Lipocalin-like domain-containing protein [Stachybotrys elegans]
MVNHTAILAALAGTYSLINTTSYFNGDPIPDAAYGAAPVGVIHYSKSGYMSATISATEPELRPQELTFPFTPDQDDADWALVGKHSIGYAGPLRISDAVPATAESGQVFHGPLIAANVPRWVGTSQVRNYTIVRRGEQTFLQIVSRRDGGYTGELWWERLD